VQVHNRKLPSNTVLEVGHQTARFRISTTSIAAPSVGIVN
jgi:hypothetical protein